MWSGCSAAGSGSHLSQDPVREGLERFPWPHIISALQERDALCSNNDDKYWWIQKHICGLSCDCCEALLTTSAQVMMMMMMNSLQLLQYTECEASEWVEELKCWAVFTVSVDGCSPAVSWRSLHCNPVSFLSTTVHYWKSTTGFYCERQGQEESFWIENTEEEESHDRMTEFLLLHECWDNRKFESQSDFYPDQ